MKNYKVFAINPGSTSTKIAMFEGEKEIFSRNISHDAEKLKELQRSQGDQLPYRKEMILNVLKERRTNLRRRRRIFRKRRRSGKCRRRRFHYW